MADPRDKKLWICDKCGTDIAGSEEIIFSDNIMAWYRHDGGTDDDGNPRDELILCGFCQPVDLRVSKK